MVDQSARADVGDDGEVQDGTRDATALDPRAIARASLQAARNASLWWTAAGVVLSCAAALVAGTAAGAYVLAAVLAAGAVVRGVRPSPGPVALSVRSKAIDLVVLGSFAVALVVLATLLPSVTD